MNKKIVNLTPHDVNFYVNDVCVNVYPPHYTKEEEHLIPRCTPEPVKIGILNDNIPLYKTIYGEVTNLPDEKEDTILIVSALVRNKRSDRKDLVSPYGAIRNDKRQIIGCTGFDTNMDESDC